MAVKKIGKAILAEQLPWTSSPMPLRLNDVLCVLKDRIADGIEIERPWIDLLAQTLRGVWEAESRTGCSASDLMRVMADHLPTVDQGEIAKAAEKAYSTAAPQRFSAARTALLLSVTFEDRERLGLRTIRWIGCSKKDWRKHQAELAKLRHEAFRRRKGVPSIEERRARERSIREHLAMLAEKHGISIATVRRRISSGELPEPACKSRSTLSGCKTRTTPILNHSHRSSFASLAGGYAEAAASRESESVAVGQARAKISNIKNAETIKIDLRSTPTTIVTALPPVTFCSAGDEDAPATPAAWEAFAERVSDFLEELGDSILASGVMPLRCNDPLTRIKHKHCLAATSLPIRCLTDSGAFLIAKSLLERATQDYCFDISLATNAEWIVDVLVAWDRDWGVPLASYRKCA